MVASNASMTEVADTKGKVVNLCAPTWFKRNENFSVANAPTRASKLRFSGNDLNYTARVLYAESSGSEALPDKDERMQEKEAILNVKYFRINRKGYPNNSYVATSFSMVCDAKDQFEAVFKRTPKYVSSDGPLSEKLSQKECTDLEEALEAVRNFLVSGPNDKYRYDNFRGYNPKMSNARGTRIGNTRFWLSEVGLKMYMENR